jgi:peptidoglycan/xylan/chitin deacetylase (PgdA/CDA1 family)
MRDLAAHPRRGGTLIATNVLGGLQEVFGFAEAQESRNRTELRFTADAVARFGLADSREIGISLGGRKPAGAAIGTLAYHLSPASSVALSALARFEDGQAGVLQRDYPGGGKAVAFGLDLGALFLKAYNNREDGVARDYVNAFEPTADVLLRAVKALYREGEERAVTLGTVPEAKSLAVILTHDVDYTKSLGNAVAYAEYERSQGVRATFFIQTKYVRDWNDEIILNDETAPLLRRLVELGMEVGSHTVAHSKVMSAFPLGSGVESYPSYRPFVERSDAASSGSIMGELRVSKFLIEMVGRSPTVVSFRPGHLSNPSSLPQALEAAGYRYSSSVTANTSLSHLPFRLTYDRGVRAQTSIFEFPITVEDEHLPRLGDRLPQALALAEKIARYGGVYVVLIHPDVLDHKLAFTRGLVEALKPKAWFGALEDFGAWWSARDAVGMDVEKLSAEYLVRLTAPGKVTGLPLQTPAGWKLVGAPPGISVSPLADGVLIREAEGPIELRFSH